MSFARRRIAVYFIIAIAASPCLAGNEGLWKEKLDTFRSEFLRTKDESRRRSLIKGLATNVNSKDSGEFTAITHDLAWDPIGFWSLSNDPQAFEKFQLEWRRLVLLPALQYPPSPLATTEAAIWLYGIWTQGNPERGFALIGAEELQAFRMLPPSSKTWDSITTMLGANRTPGHERSIFPFEGWPSIEAEKRIDAFKELLPALIAARNSGDELVQIPAHTALQLISAEFQEKHADALKSGDQRLAQITSIPEIDKAISDLDKWDATGPEAHATRLASFMKCQLMLKNPHEP